MPKENAPKKDLENIVAHVEDQPEVEGKYLLAREQVENFLSELSTEQKKNKCTIKQQWIVGGVNDGVRLRKKIYEDGSEDLYLTKKKTKKTVGGKPYTAEKEELVKKDDLKGIAFFHENWNEDNPNTISKTRYAFDYAEGNEPITLELDLFDDTDLTVAEIEFSADTIDDAIIKRDDFKSRKFFKRIGLDSVKIKPEDTLFKNKQMSINREFLTTGYKLTGYYLKLLKRVRKNK